VAIAFGILTVFSVVGQLLLHAMGISLLSFQIAGGVIVFLFALNMVLGEARESAIQSSSGEDATAVAIHPLATPIIAGPGSMLTMVLLMDNNRYSPVQQVVTIAALAAVLAALFSVFLLGEKVRRVIGANGAHLLRRIMGLILAALAVNMILSAVALWLHLPEI
jgi:multiple antibiotic resistance protein